MIEALQSIPAKVRQWIYFGYGFVVFTLGAIHVGLVAAAVTQDPIWLTVADQVVQYAAVPVAAFAGVNVTAASRPKPAPEWPEQEAGGNDARIVASSVEGRHKLKPGGVVTRVPGVGRQVPPPR